MEATQQNTTAILDRMTECRLGQAGIDHWLRTVKDFNGTWPQDFMEWMDLIERAAEEANNPNWTTFKIARFKARGAAAIAFEVCNYQD